MYTTSIIPCITSWQKDEMQRLETAKEELAYMKYHPLQDYRLTRKGDNEGDKKRKKLKRSVKL